MNIDLFLLHLPKPIDQFPFFKPDGLGMSVLLTSPGLFAVRADWHSRRSWWLLGAAVAVLIPTLLYYGGGWLQYGYRYFLDSVPFVIALCGLAAVKQGHRLRLAGAHRVRDGVMAFSVYWRTRSDGRGQLGRRASASPAAGVGRPDDRSWPWPCSRPSSLSRHRRPARHRHRPRLLPAHRPSLAGHRRLVHRPPADRATRSDPRRQPVSPHALYLFVPFLFLPRSCGGSSRSGWSPTSCGGAGPWPGCGRSWRSSCCSPRHRTRSCTATRTCGWPRRSPVACAGLASVLVTFKPSLSVLRRDRHPRPLVVDRGGRAGAGQPAVPAPVARLPDGHGQLIRQVLVLVRELAVLRHADRVAYLGSSRRGSILLLRWAAGLLRGGGHAVSESGGG